MRREFLKSVLRSEEVGPAFSNHAKISVRLYGVKHPEKSFEEMLNDIAQKYLLGSVVDNVFKSDPFKGYTQYIWRGHPITFNNIRRVHAEAMGME
jgi:hypothetical protein